MFKLASVTFLVLFYSLKAHAYYQRLDPTELPPEYSTVKDIKNQFLRNAIAKGVKLGYSSETIHTVNRFASTPLDFNGLTDLTHLKFVTIDNDHSKDLDQAMFIEFSKARNKYTLYYAIADAAYFLEPGSEIDMQAAERAFTTYLPGFDIPILPRQLSEGLCSLNPGVNRRAVVVIVEFNGDGTITKKEFDHAVIRSVAQLSYRKVQEYYELGPLHEYDGTDFQTTLDNLQTLGSNLVNNATKRGVVDYSPTELRIEPREKNGREGYDIILYERYPVERFNEQISVTANQMVAEYLHEKKLKSIHRYHPKSEDWKYAKAKRKLNGVIEGKPLKGPMHKYIKRVMDDPERDIGLGILCRINEKAIYSAVDDERGHHALKIKHYDHFTAPMRRYQDVIIHRILLASIKNEAVPYQTNDKNLPEYLRLDYMVKYAEYITDIAKDQAEIVRKNEDFVSSLLLYAHEEETVSAKVSYVYSSSKAMVVPKGHLIKRQVSNVGKVKEGEVLTLRLEESENTDNFLLDLVAAE